MPQPPTPYSLRSDFAISFMLFGSYFPAWTACLIVAIIVTALSHIALRRTGLLMAIPVLPVFYLLVGIFAGMTTWLILFSAG